ncbi:interferon-induced GTP-binding protein Mx3-like [Triplophysa dalaica]|uniref:interferon-induced GTP-binding protein Mx3-like n=1 Tax=Triplophysa dalaica TaxID=1582913 RepID=UPI0024DFDC37|nr:interferon-induced GTP-binding protein Mx3-like [Triplophysa dalaica]XP_056596279.1 interferon-induced GTP-binding protein Mx3-like [Triplophysa dalaica]
MGGELHDHLNENIRPYIDLIDHLRSIGVQKDFNIALPTIVVIGDQSTGKSSVLEALSGVALPRGTGIVTRCPLELRLRKITDAINWKATLSYRQTKAALGNSSFGHSLKGAHATEYEKKIITFDDPSLIEEHIKEAQNKLAGDGAGISEEIIVLEIRSPDVCDLTLIDLPGIARVPVQGQPSDIGTQIKTLIAKFIKKPETLIMVVVPCNNDIATTEALKIAQEVDPEGTRTLAVLTKPDLIDKGAEKRILAIAQNKVIPLHKGYIMVKCRGQQQIDENISLEEASEMERDFFKKHKHFRQLLNDNKATVSCLATELTEHLVKHIKKLLPLLDEEINRKSSATRKELNMIEGEPPQDPQGAKQYLIKTLTEFTDKIKKISSGDLIISDNLFMQLRKEYKKWSAHLDRTKSSFNHPSDVKAQILKNRGRELAGFSSYRPFEMILQSNIAQLEEPAIALVATIKSIIHKQFSDLSKDCFQRYPNLLKITADKIEDRQSGQQSKAEERIKEQLNIENMIFTQDEMYFKTLNENGNETFSDAQLPFFDVATKYTDMLNAYNKIMIIRMSDQVPMMAQYIMLKEASELLQTDMLNLLIESDVTGMLSEDHCVSERRKELQSRLECLTKTREEMNQLM